MSEIVESRIKPATVAGKILVTIDDPDFPSDLVAAWVDPDDLGLGGGGGFAEGLVVDGTTTGELLTLEDGSDNLYEDV